MISKKCSLFMILSILGIYLFTSCFVLKDYGTTSDEPSSLMLGHKYLNFYLTGHKQLDDDLPKIKNHFINKHWIIECFRHHIWWTIPSVLSSITCYIFAQKLKILNPVEAHHIAIPILVALCLFLFFLFAQKLWGSFIALISIISILTYPRFFGHTFNNIKDVPAILLASLTILCVALWILKDETKYRITIGKHIRLQTSLDIPHQEFDIQFIIA